MERTLFITILLSLIGVMQAFQLWIFSDLKDWIKNLSDRISALEKQQMQRSQARA